MPRISYICTVCNTPHSNEKSAEYCELVCEYKSNLSRLSKSILNDPQSSYNLTSNSNKLAYLINIFIENKENFNW